MWRNLSSINLNSTSHTSCLTTESFIIFTAFLVMNCLLFIPMCVTILYLGLQRWVQQWFASKPGTMRNSDIFTYHMLSMEFVGLSGYILILYGMFLNELYEMMYGYNMWLFAWYGETLFCLMTCVEHYLAVVHPVIYRNLQNQHGIGIRNITIGCVWLFNFGKLILQILKYPSTVFDLFIISFLLISLCFSFLSIVLVLTHPVVGELGKKRRLNQSKKRALCQITVIQGSLLIRCVVGLSIGFILYRKVRFHCMTLLYAIWLNLPCSLVLPLFFIERNGIYKTCCFITACYKKNTRRE